MDSMRLAPSLHSPMPSDQACDARARAWSYVFKCWREKQNAAGGTSTNGDDAMKGSNSDRARRIIQES